MEDTMTSTFNEKSNLVNRLIRQCHLDDQLRDERPAEPPRAYELRTTAQPATACPVALPVHRPVFESAASPTPPLVYRSAPQPAVSLAQQSTQRKTIMKKVVAMGFTIIVVGIIGGCVLTAVLVGIGWTDCPLNLRISNCPDKEAMLMSQAHFQERMPSHQVWELWQAAVQGDVETQSATCKGALEEVDERIGAFESELAAAQAKAAIAAETAAEAERKRKASDDALMALRAEIDYAKATTTTATDAVAEPALTITDARTQRQLAALQKQKDKFEQFCKPDMKYVGTFNLNWISVRFHVEFEKYITANKDTVEGTITFFWNEVTVRRPFEVTLNTGETIYPVTGEIDNFQIPSNHTDFNRKYGLGNTRVISTQQNEERFYNLIQSHTHLSIRLADDGPDFYICDEPGQPTLRLGVGVQKGIEEIPNVR
jgi:hypothetical protein